MPSLHHLWIRSGRPIICPLFSPCSLFSFPCFLSCSSLSTSAASFSWYLTSPLNFVSLYWPKMLSSYGYVLLPLKSIVCMGSWTYCRNFGKHRKPYSAVAPDSSGLLSADSLPGNVGNTSHVLVHLTSQGLHKISAIIVSILQVRKLRHR